MRCTAEASPARSCAGRAGKERLRHHRRGGGPADEITGEREPEPQLDHRDLRSAGDDDVQSVRRGHPRRLRTLSGRGSGRWTAEHGVAVAPVEDRRRGGRPAARARGGQEPPPGCSSTMARCWPSRSAAAAATASPPDCRDQSGDLVDELCPSVHDLRCRRGRAHDSAPGRALASSPMPLTQTPGRARPRWGRRPQGVPAPRLRRRAGQSVLATPG